MNVKLKQKLKSLTTCFCKNEYQKKRTLVFYNNILFYLDVLRGHRFDNKKIELFDYKTILKQKFFYCDEYYKGNSLYGISKSLREYCGFNKPIKACIEHGVYFGKAQIDIETTNSGLVGVINFSSNRKKYLRPITQKPLISVGPYIKYAKSYISSNTLKDYKEKYGKTLLVFPSHSGEGVTTVYNLDELCSEIDKIRIEGSFKTVIICLYYKDVEIGRNDYYESKGYIVACSGKREDPNFLSRQRALIEISDVTASNAIGTHVGYSIALNKPHILINQKTDFETESQIAAGQIAENELIAIENKNEVKCHFTSYSEHISDNQLQICDKYWGLNEFKSKDELLDLLNKLDRVFDDSKKKEELFVDKSYQIFGKSCSEMT